MKRKRGKLLKIFSLNQHRKRLDARSHSYELRSLEKLKTATVEGGSPVQTRGSSKSLKKHLENLRFEFIGQRELVYEHARLIVLLRRGYREDQTYTLFHDLWMTEAKFLCDALNIRWLVSAADTFADHDSDLAVRSMGLCVSLLTNTVKMYESERYITDVVQSKVSDQKTLFHDLWMTEAKFLCDALNIRWLVSAADTFADHDSDLAVRSMGLCVSLLTNTVKMYESERYITDVVQSKVSDQKIAVLQSELVPLFEGLSFFTVGTDDSLRNMRWRIDSLADAHPLGLILQTVFIRLQENENVFARMRALHRRERTAWW